MQVQSSAFKAGEFIPQSFSADGGNISPPIEWSDMPEGSNSYALICDDPDAPGGMFCHWLVYNIPPDMTALPTNFSRSSKVSHGIAEGKNSAGSIGWFGPKPPTGTQHTYVFRVLALNEKTSLPSGLTREELLEKLARKIIAERQLTAEFRSQ